MKKARHVDSIDMVTVLPVLVSMVICAAICAAFCIEITVPALRRSYVASERAAQERFFLTKLRIVRKYYPQLHELTYTEILEAYDVDALYDNIGSV